MKVKSTAFDSNSTVPDTYTCNGADISPPLSWSEVSDEVKSFAVVCEDPDAPGGVFKHWGIFNIPADQTSLPEGVSPEADDYVEAKNDFGNVGYGGPCPPQVHVVHHYHFKVYALNQEHLDLPSGCTIEQLQGQLDAFSVDEAELVGLYERS